MTRYEWDDNECEECGKKDNTDAYFYDDLGALLCEECFELGEE